MPQFPGPSFLVQRSRWTTPGYPGLGDLPRRLPAVCPVATFPDLASAQSECAQREGQARQGVNPFALGGPALFYQTHLDAGRLNDWLLDRGLTPPADQQAGHAAWRAWWDAEHRRLSADQRQAVWEALDKVRFFAVSERRATAFVVVELSWKVGVQTGDLLESDCEGGWLRQVFRSHGQAEKAAAELGAQRRQDECDGMENEGWSHSGFEVERLSGPWAPGGTYTVEEAPFVEVSEISLEDEEVGPTAYLLWRWAIDPEGPFCTNCNGDPTESQVPLALFASRQRAKDAARKAEEEARHLVSPFAFPPPNEGASQDPHAALTSLSYRGLQDGVRQLGLVPPGGGRRSKAPARFVSRDWLAWWDAHVDGMTDAQREGVWQLLDRLRFHSVIEVKVEG